MQEFNVKYARSVIRVVVVSLLCVSGCTGCKCAKKVKPVPIIFDSDMGQITMMSVRLPCCMHSRIVAMQKSCPWSQVRNTKV